MRKLKKLDLVPREEEQKNKMKKIMIISSVFALILILFGASSDRESHGFKFNDVLYEVSYYNINDEHTLEKEGHYLYLFKSMGLEEEKRKQLEQIFSSYDLLNGGTDHILGTDIEYEYDGDDEIYYGDIDNNVYVFSLKIADNPFVIFFHLENKGRGCFYLDRIGKIQNSIAFTLYGEVGDDDTRDHVRFFTYPGLDKELARFLVENYDTIEALDESSDRTVRKYPLPIEWMRLLFEKISKHLS